MKTISINTTSFGKYDQGPLELLAANGCQIVSNPYGRKLETAEILELGKDAVGMIAGTEKLSRDVLKQLPDLKVISRCGTGMDNVDLVAASEMGIAVFNTPDAPTKAVAELTVGLMLDCLRGISQADRGIRAGKWAKPMGELLSGKTLGIIGYGRIGRAVADLAQAFGARILAHDVAARSDLGEKVQMVALDELLRGSDIVSLHVPAGRPGQPLLDRSAIALMKKGAYLVNASRGGVVDEQALKEALITGNLAGAGIDVFETEPYSGGLKELETAVLTSHLGSYARQARIEMEMQAVKNLLKGIGG